MNSKIMKDRTKKFALQNARLCMELSQEPLLYPYKKQLIRASSSVGANYRAACRAKSTKDFINKLKIVEEECDESMFFLELFKELDDKNKSKINESWKEANEILSIIVASINTSKSKIYNRKS